jgi:DNA-binding MarR family transcriptional regulator
MRRPAPATVAEDVWRTIAELVRAQDRKDEACAAVGISFFRLRALRRLVDRPMTLRELAVACGVDPPYATVMVDDLQAKGYVTREPHPTDRRARMVTVSTAGRRAARKADAILLTPPPALAALPAAELATLQRILARVTGGEPEPA